MSLVALDRNPGDGGQGSSGSERSHSAGTYPPSRHAMRLMFSVSKGVHIRYATMTQPARRLLKLCTNISILASTLLPSIVGGASEIPPYVPTLVRCGILVRCTSGGAMENPASRSQHEPAWSSMIQHYPASSVHRVQKQASSDTWEVPPPRAGSLTTSMQTVSTFTLSPVARMFPLACDHWFFSYFPTS